MSLENAGELRAALQSAIEQSTRWDATRLSREILGRSKDYIRDFLNERKQSLGFFEIVKLQNALGVLLPGGSKSLIASYDPDAPDVESGEIELAEGEYGREVGDAPPDAIIQPNVRPGLGGGGQTLGTEIARGTQSFGAEGILDWWRLPDQVVRGRFRVPVKRIRCFEVMGDSMQPTIMDGDIVFVDIGHTIPSPPGIYALADVLDGVILKRLEVVSGPNSEDIVIAITSDNPRHPSTERLLPELRVRGRYLGRLTTT